MMETKQTSVRLTPDCKRFLAEERLVTGATQTVVLNRAVRVYALLSDPNRLNRLAGAGDATKITALLDHPSLHDPIPSRIKK